MRITLEGDDRQTLIARLGLSSDASDADVTAAVVTRITAEEKPADPPKADPPKADTPPPADPPADPPEEEPEPDSEDVVIVDVAAYRQLTARAGQADQLAETARIQERDGLIEAAIRAGKFPPARRGHYTARFDSDPEATKRFIAKMATNVVPVKERGKDVAEEDLEAKSDQYPPEWLPERQAQAAGNGAQPSGERKSRIHSED